MYPHGDKYALNETMQNCVKKHCIVLGAKMAILAWFLSLHKTKIWSDI